MKRLIVNADDFGMTGGVNRAVVEAHQAGIVTSATMMATGRAFAEATALALSHPQLKIGCHVTLLQGMPLLEPARLPTLTRTQAGKPSLRNGFGGFAVAALSRRIHPEEITAEAEAQIRRLQGAGVTVEHLDTHKHVHMFPAVLRPLLRAARNCGVRAVRNPFEASPRLGPAAFLGKPKLWKRYPATQLLRGFAAGFRRMVAEENMVTTDGALGVALTGSMNEVLLERMLRRLPAGTWELVCHPAYVDSELRSLSSLRTGEQELAALTSPRIRSCLQECGIELISFADLRETKS